ncbi:hypothetical protein B0H19DRAFT_1253192 [Mycena capillaripes]|nr:hypothetical protein B0H19DRAFT_1253192 [Mycena capillaripes]
MSSDPENHPRVAQIAAVLMPPALAIAEAVSKDATAAALAGIPHVAGALANTIRANDFAAFGSALTELLTKTVATAQSSAVEAFLTHALKQHQSEILAAETVAKLQDENWELRDLISYQSRKLEMLTTERQRADERSARTIEALEEQIFCLQCELALRRTAEDLESDLPPKTEEHDEHDGPARPTKRRKSKRA